MKHVPLGMAIGLAWLSVGTPAAWAVEATLTDDTYVSGIHGSKTALALGGTTASFVLLKFDLNSTLPDGTDSSSVEKATLTLWVNKVSTPGTFKIQPITGAWDEATASSVPAVDPTIVASGVNITAKNEYVTVDLTGLVISWLAGTITDNGIVLLPDPGLNAKLDAKESTATGHGAQLEITLRPNLWPDSDVTTTAVGFQALSNAGIFPYNTDNTAVGFEALQHNDSSGNTALGSNALNQNTFGGGNTAVGSGALRSNTNGGNNTAIGGGALFVNTSGYGNNAIGSGTLSFNTTGYLNNGLGVEALHFNTTGHDNIAVGSGALYSNTTASNNDALGSSALYSNTTGHDNNAIGYFALTLNTAGSGNNALGSFALNSNTGDVNNAIGASALSLNTTGSRNDAMGSSALYANTTGDDNTAIGYTALYSNTTASGNSAVGSGALYANTTGSDNNAVGSGALHANTTGSDNNAIGSGALYANTIGVQNTALGSFALTQNTNGSDDTAVGHFALNSNTTGDGNTAVGASALATNTSSGNNTAVGRNALVTNTAGSNTAIGYNALAANTTGAFNLGIGQFGGSNLTTGDFNVDIANPGVAAEANTIRIGKQGEQTRTFIAGIYSTAGVGNTVIATSSGQLVAPSSSRRYKENIQSMGDTSGLLRLRPVTFQYKRNLDPEQVTQYGLIAEEVAEVYPGLVNFDKDGKPESIRYNFLAPMLLHELQKQHRTLEAEQKILQAQTAELRTVRAENAALRTQLQAIDEAKARQQTNTQAEQIKALTARLVDLEAAVASRGAAPVRASHTTHSGL